MWVTRDNLAALIDLYELTMAQAYLLEGMEEPAVFSMSYRKLPPGRNLMLCCGVGDVVGALQDLRFHGEVLAYLEGLGCFQKTFLDWLACFSFRGTVHAMLDGTPVFPNEPVLEVEASLPVGQLIESLLLNMIHLQMVLASKALRMVLAAGGRPVIDFGLRRMHGVDAALRGVKAYAIAGLEATSNVLGAMTYGLPVTGTMAHSYIQAHDDEAQAFAAFVSHYPTTTLLVDTYDSIQGVRHVIDLAQRVGPAFGVRAIRLDSGDLPGLARQARTLLDEAGLHQVRIIASGGLTEQSVAAMVAAEVPVDAFAVGTHMGVSEDAPTVDLAYKLTHYRGLGRMKTAPGKAMYPGRHQVFRLADGERSSDTLALRDESLEGEPLLELVLHDGNPFAEEALTVAACRSRAQRGLAALPAAMRELTPAAVPYPVHLSPALCAYRDSIQQALAVGLPPPKAASP